MTKCNCIIIEDEPLAAEILVQYIKEVAFLKLIKVCHDAIEASDYLLNNKVDLIFLDIQLPKIDGITFLKTLHNSPKVIITSAYNQYAIDGYDHNVIDYLLKPISLSRFLKAVHKLYYNQFPNEVSSPESESEFMFFNVNKKKVKIYLKDVFYIESQKEYIKIFTSQSTVVTKMTITDLEDILPEREFLRIHRSFIVAKNKIDAFTSTEVEVNKKLIPIGRSYKELIKIQLMSQ